MKDPTNNVSACEDFFLHVVEAHFRIVFKACGRKNYAIEAFTMLAQYHFLFSDRMCMQLIWSRTVNVH